MAYNGERTICRGPFRSTCRGRKSNQLPVGITSRLLAKQSLPVPKPISFEDLFNCEDKDLSSLRRIALGVGIGDAYDLDKPTLCVRITKMRERLAMSKRILSDMLNARTDMSQFAFSGLVSGHVSNARAAYIMLLYLKSTLPIDYVDLLFKESPFIGESNHGIYILADTDPMELEIPDYFPAILERSMNFKYGLSILTIALPGNLHANAIIFDNKKKILSIWEPHLIPAAKFGSFIESVITLLNNWLVQMGEKYAWFGKGWVATHSSSICPRTKLGLPIGPQDVEHKSTKPYIEDLKHIVGKGTVTKDLVGYCQLWSILFIYVKMRNPGISDSQITKYFIDLGPHKTKDIIRQFTSFATNIENNLYSWSSPTNYLERGDYVMGEVESSNIGVGRQPGRYKLIKFYAIIESVNVDENKIEAWTITSDQLGKDFEPKLYKYWADVLTLNDENNYDEIRKQFEKYNIPIPE